MLKAIYILCKCLMTKWIEWWPPVKVGELTYTNCIDMHSQKIHQRETESAQELRNNAHNINAHN